MTRSLTWEELCQVAATLPKDRAPGLPTKALRWQEIKAGYDFVPLALDGQWLTVVLVAKGQQGIPEISTAEGAVLHGLIMRVNIKGTEAQFYLDVPDAFARGAHPYNFGQSFFYPEPEKGVPLPATLSYRRRLDGTEVDVTGWEITGVICKDRPDPQGREAVRTNLTNLRAALQSDGTIELEGKTYYLYGVLKKDDNRFATWRIDAFFSLEPSTTVWVVELAQAM